VTLAQAYSRLQALGSETLRTADAAAALETSSTAAGKVLARLRAANLITRLRPGLWLVSRNVANPYGLAEAITAPQPSYISLQTALYLHGMIDQVPAVHYLVSLARTQRIRTTVGTYSVHHIVPELFGGFEARADGTKLATPEKAVFDAIYLSSARSRLFARLPELELPPDFSAAKLRYWILRIAAPNRQLMVTTRVARVLRDADRIASDAANRQRKKR